eukprot:3493613-Amphidinium_carterae.1
MPSQGGVLANVSSVPNHGVFTFNSLATKRDLISAERGLLCSCRPSVCPSCIVLLLLTPVP